MRAKQPKWFWENLYESSSKCKKRKSFRVIAAQVACREWMSHWQAIPPASFIPTARESSSVSRTSNFFFLFSTVHGSFSNLLTNNTHSLAGPHKSFSIDHTDGALWSAWEKSLHHTRQKETTRHTGRRRGGRCRVTHHLTSGRVFSSSSHERSRYLRTSAK